MKALRFLAVLAFAAGSDLSFAGSWAKNNLWDDGRAEVAVYESELVRYGLPRQFKEQLIVVKEDFVADTLVKADDPKKKTTIAVLKLNQVQKFDTENYPYSFLTSVFVRESDPREVIKITVGSQEWCGNTFKIYRGRLGENSGTLEWHSYFDGEADGSQSIALSTDDYFEDQLPLSLRELPLKEGYAQSIRVWPSLTNNRGQALQAEDRILTVTEDIVRCRAGSLPSWKVTLQKESLSDIYWFEKAFPHILTKMETHDGRKRLLYGRARWPYWDRRIPKPNILN